MVIAQVFFFYFYFCLSLIRHLQKHPYQLTKSFVPISRAWVVAGQPTRFMGFHEMAVLDI